MANLIAIPIALALDAVAGEPPFLWRRIGHPVAWMGRVIAAADHRLNVGHGRKLRGVLTLCAIMVIFTGPTIALAALLSDLPLLLNVLITAALGSVFIAHRSLYDHVHAVIAAPDMEGARAELAMIVGRDVASLDEAGVAGAALETLGESLSDGVVAPVFWFALLGLPGIIAYKVINTADSMIGHCTERHQDFGWATARVDDLVNLVPARLTALLIGLCAPHITSHHRAIRQDAARHVSPNAGWPEAALSHALGVAIGGPRRYGARHVDGVWLNEGGRAATFGDVARGLTLTTRVGLLQATLYAALAAAFAIL
ncbi:MAG: adenosylcobinamide-phosphate synthase CbiB [Pseudomonadota bacterium]